MNLAHLIDRAARFWPERDAITDGIRTMSFRDIDRRSDRLAGALLARGLTPGDRVATLMSNRLEWYDVTFGLAKAGLISAVLDPRHSPTEKAHQIADSGAKVLLTSEEDLNLLDTVDLSSIGDVIVTGDQYARMLDHAEPARMADVADDHPIDLKYTSGTTGAAKGVLHTHGSRYAGLKGMLVDLHGRPDDVLLVSGPLQRGSGAMALMFFATGALQVIRPGFDVDDVLETIQKYRITTSLLVPTMIYKLLERIDDSVDTSSLRTVHYAASPMAPDRIEQCLVRFGQVFVQSYGSTEAMGGMTMLDRTDHIPDAPRLASCGRESVTGEVRVGDEDGRLMPPNEVGEILARGPSLFTRYWNQEDATRAAFTPGGWFRTGDIGRTDEDGFIYLLDRKSDKIISGGINIYPNEIEHVLFSHPAVDEAVVFGAPDSTWGEAVTAVVRLKIGATAGTEEMRDWVRARLAAYQVPKRVDFVTEELPKGATGKMLRRVVREKYWVGHDRQIG